MRGKPLTKLVESPGRDSKGRGFSGTALGRRPQNWAGADPRTGNLKGEKCFCPGVLSSPCPGLPVPGLSCFRVAGSVPSGPCLAFVLFLFLSFGRGRHIPAPGGRDVGSSARTPTQEPAFSRYPSLRSIFSLFSAMFEVELHGLVFEYTDICITYDRHFVGHVFSLGSLQFRLPSVRVTSSYREQADVYVRFMSATFVYSPPCSRCS